MKKPSIVATVILTLAGVSLIGLFIGLVLVFGGMVNVAATDPHYRVTEFVLHESMEKAVARLAKDIPETDRPASANPLDGYYAYRELCAMCHGEPGREPTDIARGMNPVPPPLWEEVEEFTDSQNYWIIKHGIKMTGMPAFGVTQSDETLWSLVKFINLLPGMTAEQFDNFAANQVSANRP